MGPLLLIPTILECSLLVIQPVFLGYESSENPQTWIYQHQAWSAADCCRLDYDKLWDWCTEKKTCIENLINFTKLKILQSV